MTQYIIPIDPKPNQTFDIDLNGQECRFEFITRGVYMFMNMTLNRKNILNGVICLNGVDLIQYDDFGFVGRLYFKDTQGKLDPLYYGLNDRWLLIYEVEDSVQ